ncbi:MAG: methylmalonyl Co-A mutase-associated GTPase MeaB, partial [Deltaproteobacteria bacterium]|nr:methylmalonyl Co-A mutase-associated GTPase MeaB [Deltaproteobacteria bacterium]
MFSMDTLHPTTQTLLEQYSAGNTRALARLLTLVENSGPGSGEVIQAVYDPGRVSRRIGLTGAPGAGKSTMVNMLARGMMTRGESVA